MLRYLSQDMEVTEKLRTLPQAEVCFSYLGRVDQTVSGSVFFRPVQETSDRTGARGDVGVICWRLAVVWLGPTAMRLDVQRGASIDGTQLRDWPKVSSRHCVRLLCIVSLLDRRLTLPTFHKLRLSNESLMNL